MISPPSPRMWNRVEDWIMYIQVGGWVGSSGQYGCLDDKTGACHSNGGGEKGPNRTRREKIDWNYPQPLTTTTTTTMTRAFDSKLALVWIGNLFLFKKRCETDSKGGKTSAQKMMYGDAEIKQYGPTCNKYGSRSNPSFVPSFLLPPFCMHIEPLQHIAAHDMCVVRVHGLAATIANRFSHQKEEKINHLSL